MPRPRNWATWTWISASRRTAVPPRNGRFSTTCCAKGIDGIAVSVNDPDNQTEFLNKIAGQTLLVCCDSDAPKSKRVAYIGTDNEAAGEEAGKMIKECLPNGGKIMLFVGHSDAQNAKERSGGIKKALEGSNIEIIDIRTDDTDAVRAQKNAEDTLVKYPDIACLVGLWNYNGPAIFNAVRGAGKTGAGENRLLRRRSRHARRHRRRRHLRHGRPESV